MELLVTGLTWGDGTPRLRLVDWATLAVSSKPVMDGRLGWRVTDPDTRWCAGLSTFADDGGPRYRPCRWRNPVDSGRQCDRCASEEGFRWVHTATSDEGMSEPLRRYLAKPHRLYIATFADGESKVGTASDARGDGRLVEQGAVAAQYVARTDDGFAVRRLESYVSATLGVVQAKRSSSKARSLLAPRPLRNLREANAALAGRVRESLAPHPEVGPGTIVTAADWRPSPLGDALLNGGGAERLPYPEPLGDGEHGFTVISALGPTALLVLDDPSDADVLSYVVDLSSLVGVRLEPGAFRTRAHHAQTGLF